MGAEEIGEKLHRILISHNNLLDQCFELLF